MRIIILFAALLALGAGCAPRVPAPPVDDTPNYNQENCEGSGGQIVEGFCECPDGYAPDPADFCLDAEGKAGARIE